MSHIPRIIESTRRWIGAFVIGLNLCPFAQRVFQADKVRYIVSEASDEQELLTDLTRELEALAASAIDEVETTLLIHPHVLGDFLDYNDFLEVADQLLADLDLDGVIQIASFHPDYQFADTTPDAVDNYTNRSPYPMLHLLREDSITNLGCTEEELLEIPRRNVETLKRLGPEGVKKLLEEPK